LKNCNLDQGLIRTKCHPPRIATQRILRQATSQKLAGALDCKLTVVTAPAGYGKSTAVIDWLGQTELPVAWVSLDAGDNHPEVFWRYICFVLDGIQSGIAGATSYFWSSPELLRTNTHLNILLDRLSECKHEIILALDDFHVITIPEILEKFSYLVNYLPPQVHVILIGRTEPGLELAKLRLGGDLLRLDLYDLQFRTEEIARFCQVKGLIFDQEELGRIEQYTRGWAAALVAVTMAPEAKFNRSGQDLSGKFSHGEQLIERFLEEELVSKWSEQKRNFLLKTSILNNLCGPLCDAVTGLSGGNEMLRELWLQNEFLIALDNENYWYRYHTLFGNFLRKMLTKQADVSLPELHLKAARWYREQGLVDAAIHHYLQARQFDVTIGLIKSQWGLLFGQGEYSRILVWLDQIPEGLIHNNWEIIAIQVRYYTDNNLWGQAEQCLDRLRKLANCCDNGLDYQMPRKIQKKVLLLEAYLLLCRGNLAEFWTKFQAATAMDAKLGILREYYIDFNLSEISIYRSKFGLGIINIFKFDSKAFQQLLVGYREMLTQYPGFGPLTVGEYYYETGRTDEVLPYLVTAVQEAVKANCPGALVPAMVGIARIKRAQNEIAAAYDAVRECEKRLVKMNRPHWNYLLNAFRTRLNLEAGRTEAVEEWLATCKLQIYQEITKTGEYELLVLTRVLMSRARCGDAAILLQRLLTFAQAEERSHSMVEILNLLAINAVQTGDMAGALEMLERSLEIGLQEGYLRSFIDESLPMAALLDQYLLRAKEQNGPPDKHSKQLITYAANIGAAIRNSPFKTVFMSNQATAAPRIRVKCFGSFAIYQDGHPVICKNSKVRELLAYLIHNRGNAVGWEKIVEAIWPDYPYENAHTNFHTTMYLLRKFLSKHSLLEILDCGRGNYRVRPEKVESDVDEFSRIYSEYNSNPFAEPVSTAAVRRLYIGGYFEEDGFAWAYAQAAKLELMFLELSKEDPVDCL
jgi:LuxR family maltose regulon positive regulatory protein